MHDTGVLDDWLPEPTVRTVHRRVAAADRDALWAHAQRIRLADTRRLGRLVRWRIPGLAPEQTYHDMFRAYPFTVLAQDEHLLVSGLCGRIWTLARDYPDLAGAEAFARWDEPGTVRVAFAHVARELPGGRAELCSEARVQAVDAQGRLRLRAIWALVGGFERLVGAEPLDLAVSRAEHPA